MSPTSGTLPPAVESELLRVLDGPGELVEPGLRSLCERYPDHAAAILAYPVYDEDADAAFPAADREAVPAEIGPYRVLREIGTGGMGTVYLAEQREPVWRRVALKVIKLGMDTRAVLARFEAERQALAMMEHPAIAKVFDAGATAQGRPYFAMEYVEGEPITRYCDRNRLTVEARLALFRQVCAGVQHAHTKGVIHRDLTPSNVLVTAQDGQPAVKIIDFGLARATDRRLTDRTLFTAQGMILGTPEYMSPEQAGLRGLDIDTRTDVYTLGVVLFELLTGAIPFPREPLERMCRTIREVEPARPSTAVATGRVGSGEVARLRRTDADTLLARLRGDLDWIVVKCLEKDRARRYDTVGELSADVRRYLEHEPVQARAPTLAYRLRKLARRHRGQLVAAAAVMGTLLAGLVGTTSFMFAWRAQANLAEGQRQSLVRKVEEYDLLALTVRLAAARAAAGEMLPAWPEHEPAMRAWMAEQARPLLDARAQVARAVEELRRSAALPQTDAEREADRLSHPRLPLLQRLERRLGALERSAAVRAGREVEPAPPLSAAERQLAPLQLHRLAWPEVDPDETKRSFGGEPRALALARLAWEKAADSDPFTRAIVGETLAWALSANGLDREAVEQARWTAADAPSIRSKRHQDNLARLEAAAERARGTTGAAELEALRGEAAELRHEVEARQTWTFAAAGDRFLHDTLVRHLADLEAFARGEVESVQRRIAWARRLPGLSIDAHRARWEEARRAVAASDRYSARRVDLRPQMGLVPIGINPRTGLCELYDLASAADPTSIPVHDADGGLRVEGGTGIVFVLVPGGRFAMGSQREDAERPNFWHDTKLDERPVEVVEVEPFLVGRFEVTQGQWMRLAGANPSFYQGGYRVSGHVYTDAQPVTGVSWTDCARVLRAQGMELPSEAQWEYACRAGTTTAWYTGATALSLQGHANVADESTRGKFRDGFPVEDGLRDDFVQDAPVGSFAANPFGLHDVHGNVSEWCADLYASPRSMERAADDPAQALQRRVSRGGSFREPAANGARSAYREAQLPDHRSIDQGVRAARSLR
jgi:serine/threonine protein kinase/formylglycine-generating enzyme required for sulfatase activity